MPTAPSVIWVFIAGMATVITPCVLPVLPAVLSGSVGSRLRPVAIVTGMSFTFTLMGVLISAVASFTFFSEYLRWFSILFIMGMGAVLFDEDINRAYTNITSSIMNFGRQNASFLGSLQSKAPKEGLLGGLMLGMSLGILWIPCVGPILGAVFAFVAESSASTGDLLHGTVLLLVYSLGVSIPMLIIAYSGKSISGHVSWFVKKGAFLKKLSGLVLILVGLMMIFGIDKYLKKVLLPYFPVYV
ncbi:cytochrome c biogenesis CcdA family protein [Candidatus Methanoperedens nitratireducens]|uniref:Cytochrome c biogenesis protein transmembrane region n=1 Tax=Candidatus Methanoperedens nitratireducens TaxID=1392998 RepID=A0A284VL97_9EURY|nr:cytochrome c biogenesis CcdA family protein [Candidatus Methanoperedens nitroreducens]SNQ59993.1 Cytochrome c biogenesis protein transmembrane region [Candidatus Methanoperedens nitroreducens]